jgi:hypothetical protein
MASLARCSARLARCSWVNIGLTPDARDRIVGQGVQHAGCLRGAAQSEHPDRLLGLQSPHQSIEAFVAPHRHLYLG